MPRTKLCARDGPYRKLGLLINGHAKVEGKRLDELGHILGVCSKTAGEYMKNPERMRVEQLLKLARNLHIPIEDLRDGVRYQ